MNVEFDQIRRFQSRPRPSDEVLRDMVHLMALTIPIFSNTFPCLAIGIIAINERTVSAGLLDGMAGPLFGLENIPRRTFQNKRLCSVRVLGDKLGHGDIADSVNGSDEKRRRRLIVSGCCLISIVDGQSGPEENGAYEYNEF